MEQLSRIDLDAEWMKWRECLTKPLTDEENEPMEEENEGNLDPFEYCPNCGAKPGTPGDLCPALRAEPSFPEAGSIPWIGWISRILRSGSYPIFQRRLLPLNCNESPTPSGPAIWHPWGRYSIFSRLRQTFNLPLPDTVPRTIPYAWYDDRAIAPYVGGYAEYGIVSFLYDGNFYEWDPKLNEIIKLGPPSRTRFYSAFSLPPELDDTLDAKERKRLAKRRKKRGQNLRVPVVMVKTVVFEEMPAFGRLPLELVDEILFFLKPLPFPFDADFDAKAADNLGRRHGLASFLRSAKRFVDIGRRHLYQSPWLKGWYQWEDQTDEILFLRTIKQNRHLRGLKMKGIYDPIEYRPEHRVEQKPGTRRAKAAPTLRASTATDSSLKSSQEVIPETDAELKDFTI
ncbi:hypothetical protein BT69DRAFT_1357256 [Atractiella rhizophila]|nr:hypothetical protein BT69DRAFT_1357256 [Atractiella rhizophila]